MHLQMYFIFMQSCVIILRFVGKEAIFYIFRAEKS